MSPPSRVWLPPVWTAFGITILLLCDTVDAFPNEDKKNGDQRKSDESYREPPSFQTQINK